MEHQKITNLLGTTLDEVPRFITKNGQKFTESGSADDRYKPNKQIRFETSMLRSDLCDFIDAYIVVKGTITVIDPNDATKINNTLIYNTEDSGIVIPMYNLLEYSKNYKKTTGSLWNYYRDKPNSGIGGENNNVNYSVKDTKVFDLKQALQGN